METLERLKKAISYLKGKEIIFTQQDIATKMGINKTNLSTALNGNKRYLTNNFLKKFCKTFPEINYDWLVTGNGYMFKEPTKDNLVTEKHLITTTGTPLVSVEAIAGFGNSSFAISENDILGRYVVPDFAHLDFMIRVAGDSMIPRYSPGDIIGCRIIKESKFIQWGRVYVLATREQGVLIKRIDISDEEECIKAVSDNPNYKPFDVPKEEITGMALVVGVIRLE